MQLFIPDFTKLWSVAYLFGPAGFELARSDKIFFVMSLVLVLAASVFKPISGVKGKSDGHFDEKIVEMVCQHPTSAIERYNLHCRIDLRSPLKI